MRTWPAFFVVAASVALLSEARGQQYRQAQEFMTGVNPHQLTFRPIDTSRALRPSSQASTFYQPKVKPFGLNTVFPRISLGSWPPKLPNIFVLPRKDNPFQPNPIRGRNPFDPPKK